MKKMLVVVVSLLFLMGSFGTSLALKKGGKEEMPADAQGQQDQKSKQKPGQLKDKKAKPGQLKDKAPAGKQKANTER